jgi:hypothetical protein
VIAVAGETDLIRRDLRLARVRWLLAIEQENRELEFATMKTMNSLLDRLHKQRCMASRDAGSLSGQ